MALDTSVFVLVYKNQNLGRSDTNIFGRLETAGPAS